MRPEVWKRVDSLLRDLRKLPQYREVVAVVVAGSASREEEQWEGETLVGDIDLIVVTRTLRLSVRHAVGRLLQLHHDAGINGGEVSISALKRYRSVFMYEAKEMGITVDGDPSVIQDVPVAGPHDLPRWEAVRMVSNRMFEHLAAQDSDITQAQAIAKTYEALGEAQLICEQRFVPSYRARLEQVRIRPLDPLVPRLQERYQAVLEARLEGGSPLVVGSDTARADLLNGVKALLGERTNFDGELPAQWKRVSRDLFHPRQRIFWSIKMMAAGRPIAALPFADPIIKVWAQAAAEVSALPGGYPARRRQLISDWKSCPQVYETALATTRGN